MYLFTGWFSDLRWGSVQNTLMFVMLGLVAAMERDLPDEAITEDKMDLDETSELLVSNY